MTRHFVSNKDESVRLFENDFLEKFTRVHVSVPLIIYVPVVTLFFLRAVKSLNMSLAAVVSMFFVGMLIWTLVEYVMHRFVFHYQPKSRFGKDMHFLFHGVHHDYPRDSRRLVMPPAVSIPLAFFFYGLFFLLLGEPYLSPFFAGFVTGYLFYDMIHYATHHFSMTGRFGKWLKQYHLLHHYQNEDRGYGVSSPLWDFVFGTENLPKKRMSD